MRETNQIGPRIDSKLKEVFDRHLERENKALGEEVERAIKIWLANYYLVNDYAREKIPDKDVQYIKRVIGNNSYEIGRAAEKLQESQGGAATPNSLNFGESATETGSTDEPGNSLELSSDNSGIQGLESIIDEKHLKEYIIDQKEDELEKVKDADDEEIMELAENLIK